MKISGIPMEERPREKAKKYGVSALSNRELVAILLRCGTKKHSVLEVADALLKKADGIKGIAKMNLRELCTIEGVSTTRAIELQSAIELTKRMMYEQTLNDDVIESPEALYNWLQVSQGNKLQEEFLVVYLNQAHRIISSRVLFVGTIDHSTIAPRDIFREAFSIGAVAVMLVHNHPGGILSPSQADLDATRLIVTTGKLVGVRVLDHLIVTDKGCVSLKREGWLDYDETDFLI